MNSSGLIFESIKVLQIYTFMLFNLDFANDIILSCSFLFFLFIDLHFLIPTFIKQIFIPIAELAVPIELPTK